MTHRLATNCAKNYCNRTPIVKVIVENIVTCFLGGHSVYRRDPAKIYFTTRYSGWNVHPPLRFSVRTTKHAMERTNQSRLSFHHTL